MRTYTERPKARTARKVWDYFVTKHGKPPKRMWFNPTCWGRFGPVGNAWGWWVAAYGYEEYDYYIPDATRKRLGVTN